MTQSSNINALSSIASLPPFESPGLRQQRAAFGAVYGLLGGTAYVLTAALINPLTWPGLPMSMDVPEVARQWALLGLGLTALGAWAAWPAEAWRGVLGGAVVMAGVIIGFNLQTGGGSWTISTMLLMVLSVPLAVLCLPLPLLLRWMARQSVGAITHQRQRGRVVGQLTLWVVLALLLGFTPGVFNRMSARAEIAVRQIQTLMQTAAAQPAETDLPGALKALPNAREHLSQPYGLSQQRSRLSMEGFDVRVFFADGYVFTCVVVVYPGADQRPFVRGCAEGREVRP